MLQRAFRQILKLLFAHILLFLFHVHLPALLALNGPACRLFFSRFWSLPGRLTARPASDCTYRRFHCGYRVSAYSVYCFFMLLYLLVQQVLVRAASCRKTFSKRPAPPNSLISIIIPRHSCLEHKLIEESLSFCKEAFLHGAYEYRR